MALSRRSMRWRSVARGAARGPTRRRASSIPTPPTKLKVTGIDLFSVGDFADGEDRQEIVLRDAAAGVYKRLVLKDDRIIGTVLFGETADGAWFNDLKKKSVDIADMRETLDLRPGLSGRCPAGPYGGRCSLGG